MTYPIAMYPDGDWTAEAFHDACKANPRMMAVAQNEEDEKCLRLNGYVYASEIGPKPALGLMQAPDDAAA